MDNMKEKRVAIYARVSTNKKKDDPHYQDTQNQLLQLREYCKREGWQITDEYIDHESGSKADRLQFKKLFEDAGKRKFDVVLFWALDRFSREGALPSLNYLQQLEHYGVYFCSYTEAYLNNMGAFRDVVVSILATIAKQERIRQSERVKAGLERAKKEGKKLGKPKISDTKIEEIKKLRGQGVSIRNIANQVNVSHGTVGNYINE